MTPILADRFDLRRGDDLGPNYEVIKELGEGTYGIVYQVRSKHDHFTEKAAKVLKLYNNPPNIREDIAKRFEREFECGQIPSPHLVAATEKGTIKGNPFFIMDYCPNGSAKQWVGKNVGFQAIDKFASEVLQGLHTLHKGGVIHRDLKPDNILLDQYNMAKLTDFGIAGYQNSRMTRVNLLGQARDIFGTYAYIAPEQANSAVSFKSLGPTADLWSFGVTMYEIICGQLPFGPLRKDADLGEYMRRAGRGIFDPLNVHRPDSPGKWEHLIARCLESDYRKRINSAEEALSILGYKAPSDSTIPISYDFYRDLIGLQVMHGEEPTRIYNLSRAIPSSDGQVTLGWYDARNPHNNDLTIVERMTSYISRYHATIVKDSSRRAWVVKDGQYRNKQGQWGWFPSTNGTLVNGKEADQNGIELKPDDIITVGDTTLKVVVRRQ